MKTQKFVTYEQAVKLKELGFDYRTCTYYWQSKNDVYCTELNNWNQDPDYISAPTLAQAQYWMLEKFDLWIEVTRDTIETKMFSCEINHADDVYREWVGMFDNIFDALSEGIDKAIELLKET